MAKNETIVTPFGVLQYPHLTQEDPEYGKYKTLIKLTSAELKELRKQGEAYVKENYKGKKIKDWPFKDLADIGECFRASSKFKPVIVGSKNQPLGVGEGEYIGSGSTGRLMGHFAIGNDMLTFRLQKVQIKNLVLGANGGEAFPDDDDEDAEDLEVDALDI